MMAMLQGVPLAATDLDLPKLSPPGLGDQVGSILGQSIKCTGSTVCTEVITSVDAFLQHLRDLVKHKLVGVRSDS